MHKDGILVNSEPQVGNITIHAGRFYAGKFSCEREICLRECAREL